MSYDQVMSDVVRVVEAVGAGIMVVGGLIALVVAGLRWVRPATRPGTYDRLRSTLGRTILLGLEVLIIGDLVRTIVVDPTLESVGVLAVIVVLRIVLSFSLEIEIDGTVPWRRGRAARGEGNGG
jgi:uncharacterized membrane protein